MTPQPEGLTLPLRADLEKLIAQWRNKAAEHKSRARAMSDDGHETWSNGESGQSTALTTCADQLAAAVLPALGHREGHEAYGYLSRLLTSYAPQCEPLPDLMGLCTQIDNLLTGLRFGHREGQPTMADAAEMLWVVLANVSGGDWTQQSTEWQEAAARWRDNYFAAVKANADPPSSQRSET